jgi:hypothetical protein
MKLLSWILEQTSDIENIWLLKNQRALSVFSLSDNMPFSPNCSNNFLARDVEDPLSAF